VVATSFGVQIYRQSSIAITEKYVKQIERPFNRYDDTTVTADIGVVFAWQSGHRPIQWGASYGIDGAYPNSLQPALLRIYKWASMQWHKFLRNQDPVSSIDMQMAVERFPDHTAAGRSGVMKRRLTDDLLGRDIRMRSSSPTLLSEACSIGTSDLRTSLDLDFGKDRRPLSRDHRSAGDGFSTRLDRRCSTGNSNFGVDGTEASCFHPRSRPWRSSRALEGGSREAPVSTTTERDVLTRPQFSTSSPTLPFPWSVPKSQLENSQKPRTASRSPAHRNQKPPVVVSHSYEDDNTTPYEDSPNGTHGAVNRSLCSTSCDLGELVRVWHDDHCESRLNTVSISCKDSLSALRQLPTSCRDRILELFIPCGLMATDDADNRYYEKELGEYIINETLSVRIVTLSIPNDLAVSVERDESEYEYRSWTFLLTPSRVLVSQQFASHPKQYSQSFISDDVYRMHNVSNYIKCMLVGTATEDAT
jgi:hypothetical protein